MKANWVFILFLFLTVTTSTLLAEMPIGNNNPSASASATPVSLQSPTLANVLTASSGIPRGPQQLLQDYEAEMAAITRRFSDEVAAIAEAVHSGKLSSEQGQKISAEQYQISQMQFELLSAWHEMLEQDLSRNANAQPERQRQLVNDNAGEPSQE